MKNTILSLFLLFSTLSFAQGKYPMLLNFETSNIDQSISMHKFLMLNSNKAVDLKKYGNKYSEFTIVASNNERVILKYLQPSKLDSKGRCAAGEERGFILLKFDENKNILDSKNYLIDSCLWSIESEKQKAPDSNIIVYKCDNLSSEEIYLLRLDVVNVLVEME